MLNTTDESDHEQGYVALFLLKSTAAIIYNRDIFPIFHETWKNVMLRKSYFSSQHIFVA